MEQICRLCLTAPLKEMCKLTESCELLYKISSSMSIQIKLSALLPNHVCNKCIKQIENVYVFHKEIINNQKRLEELANDNQAIDSISSCITNEVLIKQEKDIDADNFNILTMNHDINVDSNDHTYLSEDEVNLSTIKHEKDQAKPKKLSKKTKKHKLKSNKNVKQPSRVKQKYDNYSFKCLMCLKNFNSQIHLKSHYYEHSSENILGDTEKTEKNNIAKLKNEIEFDHCKCEDKENCKCIKKEDTDNCKSMDNKPFLCKLCGRTYKTVYEIMCHSRAHDGPKLHCSFKCGFSTAYKGALKEHERRHGTPEYKYTCESCGKGFHVKTWYYQHLNVHNGLKPFVCDICGVGFHMDRYLSAHRSKVHKKTTSTKRHICVKCLLPCDSRDSLKRHMEEHGIKTSYLCDLCGKVFTNAQHLKCHKNIHLGVKPYSCSICKKSFAKKFNLGIHERTHTGERSHACHICGKYFVQRSTLSRHNRRHHPEIKQGVPVSEPVAATT